jgi:hypothetical protein
VYAVLLNETSFGMSTTTGPAPGGQRSRSFGSRRARSDHASPARGRERRAARSPPEGGDGAGGSLSLSLRARASTTRALARPPNSSVRVSRRDGRFHLCQSQCRVQASGREVFEAPRALAKNTPSNVIPFGTLIPTEDRYPRVKSPANSRVPPRSPYYPQ